VANHPDPLFEEYTYGDIKRRGRKLQRSLVRGDYMFFWTKIAGKQYITAYYIVQEVLPTRELMRDGRAKLRYLNPHLHGERYEGRKGLHPDDTFVIGDRRRSRRLGIPLRLTRSIAEHLSKPVRFRDDATEAENIGRGLRQPKELAEEDIDYLLREINLNNTRGEFPLVIAGWNEEEIVDLLAKNPDFLDCERLVSRKAATEGGHPDLVLEDRGGNLVVVEVKDETANEKALVQAMDYVRAVQQQNPGKQVKGAIVCPHATPRLMRNAEQTGISIYFYMGKFHVRR
jgi:hypothetical protein